MAALIYKPIINIFPRMKPKGDSFARSPLEDILETALAEKRGEGKYGKDLLEEVRRDGTVEDRRRFAVLKLTRCEMKVLVLSGRGKSPKEIGTILAVSQRTINTHRSHIYKKMGFENIHQIIEYCIRANMDSDEFMDLWIPDKKGEV